MKIDDFVKMSSQPGVQPVKVKHKLTGLVDYVDRVSPDQKNGGVIHLLKANVWRNPYFYDIVPE